MTKIPHLGSSQVVPQPEHSLRRARIWEILALTAILALSLYLRWHDLDRGLVSDEIHMIRMAFGESTEGAGNGMSYYPMLRTSINVLGRSELSARIPSFVMGVLTVVLTFFVGRRWFGGTAGIFAALVLSCSTLHISMSQYTHSYALFGLVSLLIFHSLMEVVEEQRAVHWTLLGLWSGLAFLTHHFGGFLLLPTVLTLGLLITMGSTRPPRPSWLPAVAGAITAAVAAPVILRVAPTAIELLSRVQGSGEETGFTPGSELSFEYILALFFRLSRELAADWVRAPVLVAVFWASVALGVVRLAWSGCSKRSVPFLIWCLVPGPLTVLVGHLIGLSTVEARRLIFLLPLFALLAGFGIAGVAQGAWRLLARRVAAPRWLVDAALAASVGSMLLVPLGDFYQNRRKFAQHWREVAGFLEAVTDPTDKIVIWPSRSLRYFYRGSLTSALRWSPYEQQDLAAEKHRTWLVLQRNFSFYYPGRGQVLAEWAEANRSLTLEFGYHITVHGVGRGAGEKTGVRAALARAAVQALPSSCSLRRTLAEALGEIGNVEEALRQYAHRSCGEIEAQLATVLQTKKCEWIAPSDPTAAVKCYDQLIELSAEPSGALLALARAYRARSDAVAAERTLRQAIDSDVSVEESARELAWMLAEAGRYDEAVEAVTLGGRRVSGAAEIRLGLTKARLLARAGDLEGARRELDQAYKSLGENAGWEDMVDYLYAGPGIQDAESDFSLLLEDGTPDLPALTNLLEELRRSKIMKAVMTGEYEKASKLMLDTRPSQACDMADQSLVVAEKIIRRGYDLLYRPGLQDAGKGAIHTSAEILERLANCETTADPNFLLRLGRLLSDIGEHRRAINHLERVTSLAPKDKEGWANLCLAYRRSAEFTLAIDACQEALALAPKHFWAALNLTESQLSLGNWSQAATAGERAIDLAADEKQREQSGVLTASAYAGLGDKPAACRVLGRWENQNQNDAIVRLSTDLGCAW